MKKLFTFAFLFAFATTVFAQQKNIVDYYNLIKPKLLQKAKKFHNNSAVKIVTRNKDIKNGFISFYIQPSAGVHGEALSNNYKSALVYNYSNGQFTFVKK